MTKQIDSTKLPISKSEIFWKDMENMKGKDVIEFKNKLQEMNFSKRDGDTYYEIERFAETVIDGGGLKMKPSRQFIDSLPARDMGILGDAIEKKMVEFIKIIANEKKAL